MLRSVKFQSGALWLLDQRLLPHEETWVKCVTWQAVRDAISTMVVRGAPAIGVAAAYGVVLAFAENPDPARAQHALTNAAEALMGARPTAVNLAWAVNQMLETARGSGFRSYERLVEEADKIAQEDLAMCRAIGAAGLSLLPKDATVMTHCNAGAIATAGYGTALGMIRAAHEAGLGVRVLACETRPLLQGARLTAWELQKDGIPVTLITDNMAAYFMRTQKIDAIIVGADRIALNGDAANKIGTYALSVLALYHGIPFYVAAPVSTIDGDTPYGEAIRIEERSPDEVTGFGGRRIAPDGIEVRNPAFDVTPAQNITAIITNAGVLYPPYGPRIEAVLKQHAAKARRSHHAGHQVHQGTPRKSTTGA